MKKRAKSPSFTLWDIQCCENTPPVPWLPNLICTKFTQPQLPLRSRDEEPKRAEFVIQSLENKCSKHNEDIPLNFSFNSLPSPIFIPIYSFSYVNFHFSNFAKLQDSTKCKIYKYQKSKFKKQKTKYLSISNTINYQPKTNPPNLLSYPLSSPPLPIPAPAHRPPPWE